MSFGYEDDLFGRADELPTLKPAKDRVHGDRLVVRGEHADSASQGASLPKPKHGCPAEASFRSDIPVVKCSYGTDYISYNFGRIPHGTEPRSGLPRAGWNDLGNRFAEFRDTHRRTRLPYLFEYSQARCFEFGGSDFPHILFCTIVKDHGQNVPWRVRYGTAGPRDQREMSTHGSSHESSKMELSPPPS